MGNKVFIDLLIDESIQVPIFYCVQGEFHILSFNVASTGFLPTDSKHFDMPNLTLYKIIWLNNKILEN